MSLGPEGPPPNSCAGSPVEARMKQVDVPAVPHRGPDAAHRSMDACSSDVDIVGCKAHEHRPRLPPSVVDAARVQRIAGRSGVSDDAEHHRCEPGAGVVLEAAGERGGARLFGDLEGGGDAADHQ